MLHLASQPRLRRCAWLGVLIVVLSAWGVAAQTVRADALEILKDDLEAIQARVILIERAQSEIDVAYFAIADDNLALAFLALLRDAARRGVTVRLIVDATQNDIPGGVQTELIREGVAIREYHPISCRRPLWTNRRLHDKLLIADACQMIIGSRNLDYRNFGLAERSFVDRDAYVRGDAASEAHRYFECLWSSDDVRPTDPTKWLRLRDDAECTVADLSRRLRCGSLTPAAALDQALCDLAACGVVGTEVCESCAAGPSELACVRFLCDYGGRKRHPAAISQQILQLVAGARDTIILESPYLVVSRHLDDALAHAQARGVHVIILTNSLASTDQTLVYAGYANQKRRLLARGVEFWEFAGPDHFHAKAALIDGRIAVIGSYNFDPRSERLNTETAVVARDPCVVDDLVDSMAGHFAGSWRIGPDGKPVGSTIRHPGAEPAKIRQLRVARLVAPLIKRHL